jgi:hypothetical protein
MQDSRICEHFCVDIKKCFIFALRKNLENQDKLRYNETYLPTIKKKES